MKLDTSRPYGIIFTVDNDVNTQFFGQDGYAFDLASHEMVYDMEPDSRRTAPEPVAEPPAAGPVSFEVEVPPSPLPPDKPAPPEDKPTKPKSQTATCRSCGKEFLIPPVQGRAAAVARLKKHLREAHGIEPQENTEELPE